MAVCWCRDKNCERIFAGEELKGIDVFSENVVLPCGHKAAVFVPYFRSQNLIRNQLGVIQKILYLNLDDGLDRTI